MPNTRPYRLMIPVGFAVVEWQDATGEHWICARDHGDGTFTAVTKAYTKRQAPLRELYRYIALRHIDVSKVEAV